ncbi:MAG: NAD(P)H-hydrate epimerase [Thaumarchaeota archaeon]|nr:NAD(P)H-hydrate epimerase [Candidatus Calditenuaceae archaeon]MDW8041292.1 NAD(P)H-hydrate epimerase [Nitrososphaerota archaeon]
MDRGLRSYRSIDIEVVDLNSEYLGVGRRTLMENAGNAVARYVMEQEGSLSSKRVVVIAGPGNNGGDALVAARHLAGLCGSLSVVLVSRDGTPKTEEASDAFRPLTNMSLSVRLFRVTEERLGEDVRSYIAGSDVVIDGLFGTGVRGSVREPYRSVIEAVNVAAGRVYSIDVPSGLNPDTGEGELYVRADHTICLHGLKPFAGRVRAGSIAVRSIGAPPEAETIAGPGDAAVAVRQLKGGVQVRISKDSGALSEGALAAARSLGAQALAIGSSSFRAEARSVSFAFERTGAGSEVLLERSSGTDRSVVETMEVARRRSKEIGGAVWRIGGVDAFHTGEQGKANWIEPAHSNDFSVGAMIGAAAVLASCCDDLHYAIGAAIYLTRRALRSASAEDRTSYIETLVEEVRRTRGPAG